MNSSLSDAQYYERVPTLQEFCPLIAEGSTEVHRAYLNFEFRDQFDQVELWGMAEFFQGFSV